MLDAISVKMKASNVLFSILAASVAVIAAPTVNNDGLVGRSADSLTAREFQEIADLMKRHHAVRTDLIK